MTTDSLFSNSSAAQSAARALLSSIPGWRARPAQLTPLHGGLQHDVYLVESIGYKYVLRVASEVVAAGGGSRELECYLQQQAAGQGLAAPVLFSDTRRGLILMEYLHGQVLTPTELAAPDMLRELGELLRQLHALPLCGVNFDPSAAADDYLAELGEDLPDSSIAQHCLDIIVATPRPRERRCCHNDLIAANMIRGTTLRLIDFEYACDNEPMFDLASVLCWHNLGSDERDVLLQAYARNITDDINARLDAQCRLFDALQWLWLAVRQRKRPEDWAGQQMVAVEQRLG
ncbi:MAG: phosphotransferase [Woeseia sp.]